MNLEKCFICKRPVLEFKGQFNKFDTYLLDDNDEAYQQGAYGWCHTICLSASRWRKFWIERCINHQTKVLGLVKIGSTDTLTALQNPRTKEIIVLKNNGVIFSIKPSELGSEKACLNGFLLPVLEEINLEFDDLKLANEIRDNLVKSKRFSLSKLIEVLSLNDTILYPEGVGNGVIIFNKSLKREWMGNWLSAIVEYSQFIPQEVMDLIRSSYKITE